MTDQAISPLRRRMIEDMTIRKFAPKTQHDKLAAWALTSEPRRRI
jgi:integrase/recombinase XerD